MAKWATIWRSSPRCNATPMRASSPSASAAASTTSCSTAWRATAAARWSTSDSRTMAPPPPAASPSARAAGCSPISPSIGGGGPPPLPRPAPRATRVAREFDFLMALDDLVIRGQIDLWFEEGGELVVVDYKTDDVTAAEAHHRARDYQLQLRLYALALERVAGRAPDRAWLHFLRPNTLVEVDLTPSLIESPEQTVRDFQQAQSNLNFPLSEADHCQRCPFYRDLCPAPQSAPHPNPSRDAPIGAGRLVGGPE